MTGDKLDLKPSLTKADLNFEAVIKSEEYTNDLFGNPPFEAPDGIKYYLSVYKHGFCMTPTDEFLRLEYNGDRNLGFYFYADDLPDDIQADPWTYLKKYWDQPVWQTGIAQFVTRAHGEAIGTEDEDWDIEKYTDYYYSRNDTTRRTIPEAIMGALKERNKICA